MLLFFFFNSDLRRVKELQNWTREGENSIFGGQEAEQVLSGVALHSQGRVNGGIRTWATDSLKHGAPASILRRLKLVTFTKVEKVGDTYEDLF